MTQHPYTYDRDRVVAAVRDFYNFLSRIPRWTAADFWDAPPGGWRELTDEALAPLGKTAAVNDLLRHLPYVMPVREPGDDIDEDGISGAGSSGDKMCVAPETQAIDYPHRYTLDALAEGSIDGIVSPYGAGSIPAHVAVLTSGHKHGSWLLVDTQEGTATDFVMFERPQRPEPALGSPDYWRAYQTLPVGEMLAEWKAKFLQLEWVVVPDDYEDGVMYRMDEETDQVRDIYRQHGWPASFQRQACRRALTDWYKARQRRQDAEYEESEGRIADIYASYRVVGEPGDGGGNL